MNEAVSQIIAALEKLGASATGTAWPMLVESVRRAADVSIKIGQWILWIALAAAAIGTVGAIRAFRNEDAPSELLMTFGYAVAIVLCIFAACTIGNGMKDVVAPELGALKLLRGGM